MKTYDCIVRVSQGAMYCLLFFMLTFSSCVAQGLQFTKSLPDHLVVVEGSTVTLECIIKSGSPVRIGWARNGDMIQSTQSDDDDMYISYTTLHGVKTDEDGDRIKCEGVGSDRVVNSSSVIRVRPRQYKKGYFVKIGTEFRAPGCYADCLSSSIRTEWYHDNNTIVFDTRTKLVESGDLVLSDIRWDDMGMYTCTCTAKNIKNSRSVFVYPYHEEK